MHKYKLNHIMTTRKSGRVHFCIKYRNFLLLFECQKCKINMHEKTDK